MTPHRAVLLAVCAAVVITAPAFAAPRATGKRVPVQPAIVRVMDGDTMELHWSSADVETVRVLGIDTAELFGTKEHTPGPHGPMDPEGAEGRGFAKGAFSASDRIELMRAATRDRYGRTLGYFFLGGRNYSVMAIEARLAKETITRFGDNGFPNEARAVLEAARQAGVEAAARAPRKYRSRSK